MLRREKVTIQDIADRANVSISTVSRVLSGSANVAEDKRTAVMRVVEELDYRPNLFARGLASGQSMTVGVLTQNIGSPFYDAIMRGIITGFAGTGYSPIFADAQWRISLEEELLKKLLGRQVDGLIMVGGNLPAGTLKELARTVALILVARDLPEMRDHCIFTDNFQAAYDATRFLIDSGHRHIAHIAGPNEHQDAQSRREGYMHALLEAGLEVDPNLVVEGSFRQQSGVLAVESLFTRGVPFSAIFSANDQMAFGARLALYRRGVRVPDDVSLIGYDDQSDSAFMTPPLTTVHQPADEMGEAAAAAVLNQLNDEPFETPRYPTRLVVRESVSRLR